MHACAVTLLALTVLALGPAAAHAETPGTATLGSVLSAFLADSAARSRGLPWSAGEALPVKWQSPKAVKNPDAWLSRKGLTLARTGTVLVDLGKDDPVEMTLQVFGSPEGVQRTSIGLAYQGDFDPDPQGRLEGALAGEGFDLRALKCDRKTEGAMFGNVAYIMKAPRKTASALWETWNCSGTGSCSLTLTILYRKADLADVECASP